MGYGRPQRRPRHSFDRPLDRPKDSLGDSHHSRCDRALRSPLRSPAYWVEALPDRVAADSIVNRLASNARQLNLGDVDMRQLGDDRARAQPDHWE